MNQVKIYLLLLLLSTIACKGVDENKTGQAVTYRNPVLASSAPDPSIIQVEDGSFYLYSTEDVHNLPIYHSYDLVHWSLAGTAFTNETRPDFEPKGGLWAPDINRINGKYVLYYSMSVWGGEWTCGIGVATSDKPEGPFTDLGMLFRSNEIDVQNSIDPYYIEDNGKKYLFWGSFHGIYGIELAADGLSVLPGAEKKQVAGTAYEGTYIHKRGAYYYLFASIGSCCEGLSSTYTTVVGRSTDLFGPYFDKNRQPMLNNNHEIVIQKNEAFVGVGHNSEIVQDEAGNDWMLYHGVNVTNPNGRCLLLDRIIWTNDWPSTKTNSPSLESEVPYFPGSTLQNPLAVSFGDPFVLKASSGKFYMYGSGGVKDGFRACVSSDLVHWEELGRVYQGNTSESWGVANFWAPEVYEINGKYYMLFSADWRENPTNELENFRIGVAVSDKPEGPFLDLRNRPIFDPGYPVIDGNLLFEDGKVYLYYSRCCYKNPVQSEVADWAKAQGWFDTVEESWVYGVELKPDFSGIVGEPRLLLSPPKHMDDPQVEWESRSVTSREVNRRWTEGSFIVKDKGTYYIMYSANYFGGKNYAVGYATSSNPLGPFVKADNNPVLQKNTETGGKVTGTGHCMVLNTGSQLYCVYHGRTEATGEDRVVFIDPMEILPGGKLVVHGPNTELQHIITK
ncbi:hypothetical protein FACS189414_1510 [Bacteroidia bacterium]|nr:hypothetical protein FACS189414_1510 [Bacteroidia bacterium]